MPTRRRFVLAAAAFASSQTAFTASGYDLLSRGGRVMDPGRHVGDLLDVAIRDGRSAAVRKDIRVAAATMVDAVGMQVGAAADVTVLQLGEGGYEFVDNYRNKRTAPQRLFTRAVVMGGRRVA